MVCIISDGSRLRSYDLTQNDQIWHGNTRGKKHISRGQPRTSLSSGAGAAASSKFLVLHARTQHKNRNQILKGDQTRCKENFCSVDHALLWSKLFGDNNADVRPVCSS